MLTPAEKRKAVWEETMKASIYNATVSILTKHGVDGLRMDRVADAAEVATGTLYNYFKNKEELLLHVVMTIFEPFHRRLIEIRDENLAPQKKLSHYFRSILRSFEENQNLIAILGERTKLSLKTQDGKSLERYLDQIIIDIIADIIQEGIGKGDFRLCDALTTATLIHGAVMGLINFKISKVVSSASVDEEVAACKELILPGLLRRKHS